MRKEARTLLLTLALLGCSASCMAQDGRHDRSQQEQAPGAPFESAEQVLDALENADDALRTFHSGIAYTTIRDLGGAMTRRTGEIAFASDEQADGAPRRRFAVRFETLLRGGRYIEGDAALQTLAFDGRWLWEKIHSERQINKREIVRQGETIDPFELGDGPFPPLPIGQQKDEILRRYDVRLVPWNDSLLADPDLDPSYPDEKLEIEMASALQDFARGSVQLRLVPRQAAADARFAEIRLWYKPDEQGRLLPRMSRTVDAASRDVSVVQLMHPLTINGPAREDLLTMSTESDNPDNPWNITETRLPPQRPASGSDR